MPVYNLDGSLALDHEEFPRPGTTAESLAKLRPSFEVVADYRHTEDSKTYRELVAQKFPDLTIEHVHHAGNSSGVVDGAAAILLASEAYATAHTLKPRARVVATANMGDDPTLMLNAPVPAARKVLARAGMTLDDIDLFEINEAFAVVSEKFQRDLNLDRDKVNVNGGAMALGHPIGATGSILIGTVLDELERRDLLSSGLQDLQTLEGATQRQAWEEAEACATRLEARLAQTSQSHSSEARAAATHLARLAGPAMRGMRAERTLAGVAARVGRIVRRPDGVAVRMPTHASASSSRASTAASRPRATSPFTALRASGRSRVMTPMWSSAA